MTGQRFIDLGHDAFSQTLAANGDYSFAILGKALQVSLLFS